MTENVNILTDAAAMSLALGRRLAGLRRERGLSLDRLAQASGVSKGMLVQIEAGRAKAEKALGPKFNIRAFHDMVLAQGSVPLPVLAAEIDAFIAGGGVGPYPDEEK